jgi:acetate---CoA ligase (ADP-forming) subunit alpha
MNVTSDLDVFLNPSSVAVIGASERPGSWGSRMVISLQSSRYPGKIYPVNRRTEKIFGIPAFKDIRDIERTVELAILTIPDHAVEEAIVACGEKGVNGIIIVTAGFSEATKNGVKKEGGMAELAHSYGMRLIGPNVSGIFNFHAAFMAAAPTGGELLPTSLVAVSQGGFALYDLFASAFHLGMGVGQFVHTGNECDLTVTDFLEYFGHDPKVKAVVMYLETLRDGRRFMDVARRVTRKKPVIIYRAGGTAAGARAANSHTGALAAGRKELFQGALNQSGAILSPTMEMLIPLGHALCERPPMRGRRIGIITLGGSWGVALTDALQEEGLEVPELSQGVQKALRDLGMPERASTKNPVDFGASGIMTAEETLPAIARQIMASGDVDALIMHGLGRPSGAAGGDGKMQLIMSDAEKKMMREFTALEKELDMPVILGAHHVRWVCESIDALYEEGARFSHRLDETAQMLSLMNEYYLKRRLL